jgi:hypothetical protein
MENYLKSYDQLFYNPMSGARDTAQTMESLLGASNALNVSRINQLQFQDAMKSREISDIIKQGSLDYAKNNLAPQQAMTQQAPSPPINPTNTPLDYQRPQGNMASFINNYRENLTNPNQPPAATALPQAPSKPITPSTPFPELEKHASYLDVAEKRAIKENDKDLFAAIQQKKQELQTVAGQQITTAAAQLKTLKDSMGLGNLKKNWESLKGLNPVWERIKMDDLDEKGVIVKDPQGKQIGMWVSDENGKTQFVKTEEKQNTDFTTFKAGFERKEGETDQQYNKRVSDEWESKQDKRAMNKSAFTINMQNPPEDKFKNWEPEEKEKAFQAKMITGKDQRFAFGDKSSYNSFNHEYNKYLTRKGLTAGDVARMQTDYKAGNSSVSFQRKNYDMMNGFAQNIDLQIQKVQKIYGEIQRTDIRLLDKPIRDLKVIAKGSGKEANLASYLIEVSNEIGKMSTGSTASIRELSESAQKQWQKIHDPNLSIKELMTVLRGTHDQAQMRLQTTKLAMDATRQMITGLAEEKENITDKSKGQVLTITPQTTKAQIRADIRKHNSADVTDAAINEYIAREYSGQPEN